MANSLANGFKQYLADGTINLLSSTIYCALFDSSFTPDVDAHDNWGDIKASEISGAGYTTGGAELTSKTVTHDDGTNKGVWDGADVVWASVTLTNARFAVLYKSTGVDATSKIIGFWDFGSNQSPTGVQFTVQWSASGIMTLG